MYNFLRLLCDNPARTEETAGEGLGSRPVGPEVPAGICGVDVNQERWTPLKIVKAAADYFAGRGVGEPRLDAELLLAEVLGVDRIRLYTDFDRVLSDSEVDRYRELVRERASGRPAKYIIANCEFYSVELAVDERVLIPRPETEHLVDRALEILREGAWDAFPLVVDLCTGSGAIVIALAVNFPDASYVATDSSPGAVELARANAASAGVREKTEFLIGDLFETLATMGLEDRVDMVVTNPPYVSEDEWRDMPREITGWEPREALVAGPRGSEVQVRILKDALAFLRPGGVLLMEMDPAQGDELERAAARFGGWGPPRFIPDYAKRLRVMEVEKKQ